MVKTFIDTNIWLAQGIDHANPLNRALRQFSEDGYYEMFVTDIVFWELVNKLTDRAVERISRIQSHDTLHLINRIFDSQLERIDNSVLEVKVREHFGEKVSTFFEEMDIEIIEISTEAHIRSIQDFYDRRRLFSPSKKKDQFRDSLNYHQCLLERVFHEGWETGSNLSGRVNIITNDGDFQVDSADGLIIVKPSTEAYLVEEIEIQPRSPQKASEFLKYSQKILEALARGVDGEEFFDSSVARRLLEAAQHPSAQLSIESVYKVEGPIDENFFILFGDALLPLLPSAFGSEDHDAIKEVSAQVMKIGITVDISIEDEEISYLNARPRTVFGVRLR